MAREYGTKKTVLLVLSKSDNIKIIDWAVISMLDRSGSKKAFQVIHVRMDPHRGDEKTTSVSGWTLTEETRRKSNEPHFPRQTMEMSFSHSETVITMTAT